jgi:hypothetical protein
MAHYAFINADFVVTEVIVGVSESELIEGQPPEAWYGQFRGAVCKRTSYNTHGGIHYTDGEPSADQSKAYRKNYAGIGYSYDQDRDAFIPPKPYPSWILNESTCQWDAPVPYPTDGQMYLWDEDNQQWTVAVSQP